MSRTSPHDNLPEEWRALLEPIDGRHEMPPTDKVDAVAILRLLSAKPGRLEQLFDPNVHTRERERSAELLALRLRYIAERLEGAPWPRSASTTHTQRQDLRRAARSILLRRKDILQKVAIEDWTSLLISRWGLRPGARSRVRAQVAESVRQMRKRRRQIILGARKENK
jgi:hypothetical protein